MRPIWVFFQRSLHCTATPTRLEKSHGLVKRNKNDLESSIVALGQLLSISASWSRSNNITKYCITLNVRSESQSRGRAVGKHL
jgi:hypothetical protein